jgi:UDP-galactopyranose mutase
VLARVRVRDDLNEDYFPDDAFQALPVDGYTRMVERMLDHPGIRVRLSTPHRKEMEARHDHVFTAMSIDEYFGFDLGVLPYRSIRFETHVIPAPRIFPVATVNFTHAEKYTRVTEWKNLPGHGDHPSHTVLTFEVPCDFTDNALERHYPVRDREQRNRQLYRRYAARVPAHMTFIGRCGLYAYLDMHQAVGSALASARNFLTNPAG